MRNGPHILLCSEFGTGKSTFAATLIGSPPQVGAPSLRPVLIQGFDGDSKLMPYRKRGDAIKREKGPYCEIERIYLKGKEVAIIEHWQEREGRGGLGVTVKGGGKSLTNRYLKQGEAFERYLERMRNFYEEVEDGNYWAVVVDSGTSMEYAGRSYLQGVMQVSDGQMIYAQVTDELERFLLATFPNLPVTTIVIVHALPERVKELTSRGKMKVRGTAGDVPYEIRLPGRLANDPYGTYGEIYRAFVTFERDEGGNKKPVYYIQTTRDEIWRCQSQLGISGPLGPSPTFATVYKAALPFAGKEEGNGSTDHNRN